MSNLLAEFQDFTQDLDVLLLCPAVSQEIKLFARLLANCVIHDRQSLKSHVGVDRVFIAARLKFTEDRLRDTLELLLGELDWGRCVVDVDLEIFLQLDQILSQLLYLLLLLLTETEKFLKTDCKPGGL